MATSTRARPPQFAEGVRYSEVWALCLIRCQQNARELAAAGLGDDVGQDLEVLDRSITYLRGYLDSGECGPNVELLCEACHRVGDRDRVVAFQCPAYEEELWSADRADRWTGALRETPPYDDGTAIQ